MPLTPRPSSELKDKINVTVSLIRRQEATAEDFKEICNILEWIGDWIDGQVQPNDFYKFHVSMEALIAAYPNGSVPNGSWAVITPDGAPQYVATMTNGIWEASDNTAPIQKYASKVALPSTGVEAVIYIVEDEKLLALWYNGKYNYFGKDGANGLDAYEVWLAMGNTGTKEEFFASIGLKFDAEVSAATAKTTPVDADLFGILDSAASFVTKKLSWSNLKAALKTYFDTLYEPKESGSGTTVSGIEIIEEENQFDGTFDKSDGNYHFWPNKVSGTPLGLLQISTTKKVGTQDIVQVKGDMIADVNNFIPNTWRFTGQPVTNNASKLNELRSELLVDDLVAIHNRVFDYIDTEAPSAPINLSSPSKTDTTINLSWDAASDNVGVVVYNMKAVKVSDSSEVTAQSNTTSGQITGLDPEEDYNITVTAEDAAGNISAASNQISVTTDAALITPASLSNINFWYDDADLATITKNPSNEVSAQTDKAGNNDLTAQGTPLYSNGSIQFVEADNDRLYNTTPIALLEHSQEFHGFLIFKNGSATQESFIINMTQVGSGVTDGFGIGLRDGKLGVAVLKDNAWQSNKGVSFSDTSNFHKLEFKYKAGVVTAWLDGVEMTASGPVWTQNNLGIYIGGSNLDTDEVKSFTRKEWFGVSGEMTAQERTDMLNYISSKHGL